MNKLITQLAAVMPRRFEYCDVGASSGIIDPWNSYDQIISTLRFEPNKEEYVKIKGRNKNDKLYNVALYKESGKQDLYITKSPQCSSLYEPNIELLRDFSIVEWFEIEKKNQIDTVSLDELCAQESIKYIDFIKIDVQGAELDIIKGAEGALSNRILGMSVEVEFVPLYKNQPLFAEVDNYVRNAFQLELYDLTKCYCKYREGVDCGSSKGKLLCGEALYLISPALLIKRCKLLDNSEAGQQIIMACVMGCVYGYIDYVLCLLNRADIDKYLSKGIIEKIRSIAIRYGGGIGYCGRGAGRIENLFKLFSSLFMKTYKGWKTDGQYLGSRKQHGVFI